MFEKGNLKENECRMQSNFTVENSRLRILRMNGQTKDIVYCERKIIFKRQKRNQIINNS
jgi:hypothetical protein